MRADIVKLTLIYQGVIFIYVTKKSKSYQRK